MKKFLLLIILSVAWQTLLSQTFTEETNIILPGVSGDVAWGDYDNDGFLDILIAGYGGNHDDIFTIYKNNGNNSFTEQNNYSLEGFEVKKAIWADYNNDGYLDIIATGNRIDATGENEGLFFSIFKNNGNNTFTEMSEINIDGLQHYNSSIDFGDYNNDGYGDIVLSGRDEYGSISKVYRNINGSYFIYQDGIILYPIEDGTIVWGDYNNDGLLDLVLAGGMWTHRTIVYQNNGNNNFTESVDTCLIDITHSSIDLGDYDNDGDLDILLTGFYGYYLNYEIVTFIYRNDGDNVFTNINVSIMGVQGEAKWGDYNNDGLLDIFLLGTDTSSNKVAFLYKNNGDDTFTEITEENFYGVSDGSIAWSDYDNDGDLDIILAGITENSEWITKIFKNNSDVINSKPQSPTGLTSEVVGDYAKLNWNKAFDNESSQNGLSYNIVVGTSPGGNDIISPNADILNGYRRIPSRGSIQDTSYIIKDLDTGTYYWRVQCIDHSFIGSEFSDENSFNITFSNSISPVQDQILCPEQDGIELKVAETQIPDTRQWKYSRFPGGPYDYYIDNESDTVFVPSFSDRGKYYIVCTSKFGNDSVTSNEVKVVVSNFIEQTEIKLPGVEKGSSCWGDYNNDGLYDILITGYNYPEGEIAKIFKNNGDNNFTEETEIILPGVFQSSVDWGDYNNDGYLDILLSGNKYFSYTSVGERICKIYKNNGDNSFSEQTEISLIGLDNGSVKWYDIDNDGDLDIILSGVSVAGNQVFKIYKNDLNGNFSIYNVEVVPFSNGDLAVVDYDNDNFNDIIITGYDYNGKKSTIIYRNDGIGNFEEQNEISLIGIVESSIDFGDYDCDGDLDILCSGTVSPNYIDGPRTKVYQNNGDNTFSEQQNIFSTEVTRGSVKWFDYNNDGYLDIFICGVSYYGDRRISKIYENNKNNTFTEQIGTFLVGVDYSSVATSDFDNDGDLDLLITGDSDDFHYISRIYKNITVSNNNRPHAPGALTTKVNGTSALLKWSQAFDIETPPKGLSYNVFVSKISNGKLIVNPMADISSGTRRVSAMGNAFLDTSFLLENLDTGLYIWSVQAIDNSFLGSNFAQIDTFRVKPKFSKEFVLGFGDQSVDYVTCGDYDNDGYIDIAIMGRPEWGDYSSKVYKNIDGFVFEKKDTILLSQLNMGCIDWADYNNDGYLDLIMTGAPNNSVNDGITRIFKNNKEGLLIEQEDTSLVGITDGSVEWGDCDNDGDLDILLAGYPNVDSYLDGITKIYINNDNEFLELTDIDIEGIKDGSAIWCDYDNDNDLDIILSGVLPFGQGIITRIYENRGRCNFKERQDISLIGMWSSTIDCGDYDNDGDLDILLSGNDNLSNKTTKVYRNDGSNIFTDIGAFIRGIAFGDAKWGDYDNDGDLDILMSGMSGTDLTVIYENEGNDIFKEIEIGLNGYFSAIEWCDFDNDNDLDFILNDRIYRNNINPIDSNMKAPNNLGVQYQGFGVGFFWDPVIDNQNSSEKYSYNLRVGTSPGGVEIVSPMSDVNTGYRKIPKMGNCQMNLGWRLDTLPEGTYYWSVQAIDQSFMGGAWAPEQTFTILVVRADFEVDNVCLGSPTTFKDTTLTSGDPITEWKWDFGDGNTSTLQNPTHTYTTADTFAVQLITISNQYSDTIIKNVIVKPKPIINFKVDPVCHGEPSVFVNETDEQGLTINSWSWEFGDNQDSNQQTPDPHYYSQPGKYDVRLTANSHNGCFDTLSKTVIVAKYPVVIVSANGSVKFCEGDNVLLSVDENENYQYQWKLNGVALTDSTSYHCRAFFKGDYSVEVENTLAGCLSSSSSVSVNVVDQPVIPIIDVNGYDPEDCPESSLITMEVRDSTALYDYQWKRNGLPLSGEDGPKFEGYLKEGLYSLEVTNGGCKAVSEEIEINFNYDVPEKPDIEVKGPVVWYLACTNDSANNYKWFYNGNIIEDVNKYIYVANQNLGRYKVAINMEGVCWAMSDEVTIPTTTTGIEDPDPFANLKIYPNPTPGVFTIEMDNQLYGELITRIFNTSAVKILNIKFDKSTRHFKAQVDLSGQGRGIYIISLMIDKYKTERKLVVE